MIRVATLLLAFLALGLAAVGAEAQEGPAAVFLRALQGEWRFTLVSPSGREMASGTRTLSVVDSLHLTWTDKYATGGTASGWVRYRPDLRQFEYGFPGSDGGMCTVLGQQTAPDTIRFGQEGLCPDEVLNSTLVFLAIDYHTYSQEAGFAAHYRRAPYGRRSAVAGWILGGARRARG